MNKAYSMSISVSEEELEKLKFATYKRGKAYSDLCEHIKIDDSYNFALFKQLVHSLTYKDYELRVRRTGLTTNIGS